MYWNYVLVGNQDLLPVLDRIKLFLADSKNIHTSLL